MSTRGSLPASGAGSAAEATIRTVLILGATSAIAQATARRFAADGARLFLVARDSARLDAVAADLRSRGAHTVDVFAADLTDPDGQARAIAAAVTTLPNISHALIAHGVLPDAKRADADPEYARATLDVNFLSPVTLCLRLALQFEHQRSGCLAVIGSVAGDRIRRSNYVYGTAKGGLALFLDGLRTRLQPFGATVITVKPGFVDTPMTAALPKNALFASADAVAMRIHRAMVRGRSSIVYVPGFWRLVMTGLRLTPGPVFRRLPI